MSLGNVHGYLWTFVMDIHGYLRISMDVPGECPRIFIDIYWPGMVLVEGFRVF